MLKKIILGATLINLLPLGGMGGYIHAQSNLLHYKSPATYFEEALPIGNGTQGAMVYGGVGEDKISLNDITLWTGEPDSTIYATQNIENLDLPEAPKTFLVDEEEAAKAKADSVEKQKAKPSEAIPAIREALRREDYREADRLQREVQGHFSQNYQPLGQLTIEYLDTLETVSNYKRWLDIGNATAHTVYHRGAYQYVTEYFATHPDSGMVIRITTDNPKGIHARISLSCQLRGQVSAIDGHFLVNDGYAGYASLPSYYDAKEKFAYDPNRGVHFRTKVQVEASSVRTEGDCVVVDGSREVTLYVVSATSFNGYDKDPVKQGKPYRQDGCKILQARKLQGGP